ncbi:alginate export family protein [Halopseudomonas salegens]|uniref:Alginate production protein n=1 Tax=Halopseudomonas salegens TaxID=1434072 RepID=A0A1H2HST2_9GAMM|nr:alginate export family protein [Halopseudomonas salegens]SDU34941.1 alginate production protein [Halopseudomonas salegens]
MKGLSRSQVMVAGVLLVTGSSVWAQDEAARPMGELPFADQVVTYEVRNKVTVQGGIGPEDSLLGADRESFYSLRYEPTFIWYSPEKRWPRWQVFTRGWLAYDSSSSVTPLQEENQERVEGLNAELREFYVRRNLLGDDPRFAVTVGRQRFADRLGIWWDDTFEAVRFDYTDSYSRGFAAAGQKFYYYNSDVNQLDPRDKDVFYAMGEYAWGWQNRHWLGVRMLYEHDYSGRQADDPEDFTGIRYGLFASGDGILSPWLSDYHVELAAVYGERETPSLSGTESTDIRGWALLTELGKRFDDRPWSPRLVMRAGLTDKPKEEADGFYLNRIQSDRLINQETYSTRLVSSFVRLDIRNLVYVGLAAELQPTARTSLDVRASQLWLRNRERGLPVFTNTLQDTGSKSVGQVLDLNYYWQSFPLAYRGRHFDMNTLLSASYFRAGSATGDLDDDYQVSLGIVMRY